MLRHRSTGTLGKAISWPVIIFFFTSLAASPGRLRSSFVTKIVRQLPQFGAILLWDASAVIIGGQLGPRFAQVLPWERHARVYLSAVLIIVGD